MSERIASQKKLWGHVIIVSPFHAFRPERNLPSMARTKGNMSNKHAKYQAARRLRVFFNTAVATMASFGCAFADGPTWYNPALLPPPTKFVILSFSSLVSSPFIPQALDVPGGSKDPRTFIDQNISDGGEEQQWTLRRVSHHYEIRSVSSGLVLDVPNGSTATGQ